MFKQQQFYYHNTVHTHNKIKASWFLSHDWNFPLPNVRPTFHSQVEKLPLFYPWYKEIYEMKVWNLPQVTIQNTINKSLTSIKEIYKILIKNFKRLNFESNEIFLEWLIWLLCMLYCLKIITQPTLSISQFLVKCHQIPNPKGPKTLLKLLWKIPTKFTVQNFFEVVNSPKTTTSRWESSGQSVRFTTGKSWIWFLISTLHRTWGERRSRTCNTSLGI